MWIVQESWILVSTDPRNEYKGLQLWGVNEIESEWKRHILLWKSTRKESNGNGHNYEIRWYVCIYGHIPRYESVLGVYFFVEKRCIPQYSVPPRLPPFIQRVSLLTAFRFFFWAGAFEPWGGAKEGHKLAQKLLAPWNLWKGSMYTLIYANIWKVPQTPPEHPVLKTCSGMRWKLLKKA